MSQGKHLSLEEARKMELLERFAKEQPSVGDKESFDQLLERMAKSNPE